MSHHSTQPDSTAHPYVRISDPTQRKGGGLERQTSADLKSFCERFGFKQSKKIWIDDGVSAWNGLNASPNHSLGKFLAEARRGLIPPDDCLLIENYDRLSRQNPWAAIALVSELRDLRIHVGRLDRMKILRHDSTDAGDFFEAAIEFMRGNSESNTKSFRNRDKWQKKREAARENGATITHKLPAWIHEVNGKREPIPERAAVMKRIFKLSASGYGHALIVKRFQAEGVPPFKGTHWSRAYIALILKDRRARGEFQPRLRNGDKAGAVIKDYYPAVVTEDEWDAAQNGARQRKTCPGRQGQHVNVFAGLLKNALEGDSYYCATRTDGGKHARVLVNTNAAEGRAAMRSFPFVTFERGILKRLREIDPHSILNGDQGPDETTVLGGQLASIEWELEEARTFMKAKGFSVTIGNHITELEDKQEELTVKLRLARQKAAHPLSETWGECQNLMDAIDAAGDPNDLRLRLQAKLREIVGSIQLIVVPRGRDRLAGVQIWFAGGERHRDYLILHRPPKANARARTEGGAWCTSLAKVTKPCNLDLRLREDALALAEVLGELNLVRLMRDEYLLCLPRAEAKG
jgi:DNA invertase Pin-like site-specific DNA recombinase